MNTNIPTHKVFISFHHANDENYKNKLEKLAQKNDTQFISKAIQDGDIDENLPTETIYQKIRDDYIADATVTIVLIGKDTWRRKYVDWEIASSIRDTKKNPRNGLVGILLPTCDTSCNEKASYLTADGYNFCKNKIPPRLWDNFNPTNYENIVSSKYDDIFDSNIFTHEGYANIYSWEYAVDNLKEIIDEAFQKRRTMCPDNSRARFSRNRPDYQDGWEE